MTGDRRSELERRVRLHAALADAGRLRIVDALAMGDASPSTLQHELGMASNLLAHHLRTLESAGVVTRHRSEADRRRTYLQLNPEAVDAVAAPDRLADEARGGSHEPWLAARVVFVCTRNTARSQLAAALWTQASSVPVASAGTHPADAIAAGATAAAARRGLSLTQVDPRRLDDVLRAGDLVITVCDNAHEELARGRAADPSHDPSPSGPVRPAGRLHWSVPDPVPVGTARAFDDAYDDLAWRVHHLAPRLAAS